jgi:hypothetical protein
MIPYITLFCVMFGYVFMRAFQQKNTAHSKYWWMIAPSYVMSYCDVYIGGTIVAIALGQADKNLAILTMGTAGWSSCMLATYLHDRGNI